MQNTTESKHQYLGTQRKLQYTKDNFCSAKSFFMSGSYHILPQGTFIEKNTTTISFTMQVYRGIPDPWFLIDLRCLRKCINALLCLYVFYSFPFLHAFPFPFPTLLATMIKHWFANSLTEVMNKVFCLFINVLTIFPNNI